ncbi:MAG: hypothetical protein U5J78_00730 [Parasphingorhabdus sp.]|nr:hypothetical protein [Parasphingorhabdus sp.]
MQRNNFLIGAAATLLLLGAGTFIYAGFAEQPVELPDAPPPPVAEPLTLPEAALDPDALGPTPPAAPPATREERRFNRYDRDRNDLISRLEMMSSRSKAFKQLDKDSNNLLTFEEWAAATSDRFAGADGNRDGQLTRSEFAQTRPKAAPQPKCKC